MLLFPILFDLLIETNTYQFQNYSWRLINGKHWQIIAPEVEQPEFNTSGVCSSDMVEVKGQMKMDPDPNPFAFNSVENLQKTACKKWLNREPYWRDRCQEYDRDKWLEISKNFQTKPMHFCMDRFEYPNRYGQYPMIMVTWYDAKDLCEAQGKRLCTETEWTFACEGEEATPYSYGYVRDNTACSIDKQWRRYDERNFASKDPFKVGQELDRLWQFEKAGDMPRCKSVFGISQQLGGVDEFVSAVPERKSKYISVLMGGGSIGNVRNRCRAYTRSHGPTHKYYQQSFRCCADT